MIKWFRCWLFHRSWWRAKPVYHSWDMHCEKCGRDWIEEDL
jgi:hypothetical protein